MNLIVGIAGILSIATLYVLMPVFADTYRRVRGPRVVPCPETWLATEIEIDPMRAASGAMFGRSTLCVRDCSRWQTSPAHRDCDQGCLKHISIHAVQNHGLLTAAGSHHAS